MFFATSTATVRLDLWFINQTPFTHINKTDSIFWLHTKTKQTCEWLRKLVVNTFSSTVTCSNIFSVYIKILVLRVLLCQSKVIHSSNWIVYWVFKISSKCNLNKKYFLVAMVMFFCSLVLYRPVGFNLSTSQHQPWRRGQYVPLKHWHLQMSLPDAKTQRNIIILTTVKTSNLNIWSCSYMDQVLYSLINDYTFILCAIQRVSCAS